MRKIKIKKMVCENFRCFKHKEINFTDRCLVKGKNGIGKSTLYNALLWCLFDKDMNGNTASNIRPHDEYGEEMHFVDISVAVTFDVDGREITLKKVQKENYVKDRSTKEQTFKGNVNEFSVNDIPKKQADYKAYVSENFCDEDTFLSCTNAQSFFKLDTKKRRAKLLDLANMVTDADVIAKDSDFEQLSDMLRDGTVDELMTRSKGTIKRLNDTLKALPARIDEQERSKVDIDVAELELERNRLKEEISKIENKESDIEKSLEEYTKLSDGVMDLQFAISDMKRNAKSEWLSAKINIETSYYLAKGDFKDLKSEFEQLKREKDVCADKWAKAHDRVFDENSLICPCCGQEYPKAKKDALKAEFEANKAKELADIEAQGSKLKARCERSENDLQVNEKKLADLKEKLDNFPSEPQYITKEYKSLAKELTEKENALGKCNSVEKLRSELEVEKMNLMSDLADVNGQISKSQRNVDIDERISELQKEQRDIAQKIANEERTLDLLERFNRAKMTALTDAINGHFKMVSWELFKEQINGGYQDVCYATVNGTNREKGLNDSDCLLADLDILETFQVMNDVQLPLFLDRAESINETRIPSTDCQLIILAVSNDENMLVKEMEKCNR